jgi:16S rRNA (uracil1498-N3)-methyltransferase
MRIPRARVDAPLRPGERVELPPEEARHLDVVLRRRKGDPVVLLAPSGAWRGSIAESERSGGASRVLVEIIEAAPGEEPGGAPWTVACGITRGASFELAIRMGSELGLDALLPVLTRRTVARTAGPEKRRRWERIAAEASKQCGRAQSLEVAEPVTLARLLEGFAGGGGATGWVAIPGAVLPPRQDLEASAGRRSLFLVGPEGGLDPEEIALARAAGLREIGFPCPVLRTPTAVALLGALGMLLAAPVSGSSEKKENHLEPNGRRT